MNFTSGYLRTKRVMGCLQDGVTPVLWRFPAGYRTGAPRGCQSPWSTKPRFALQLTDDEKAEAFLAAL